MIYFELSIREYFIFVNYNNIILSHIQRMQNIKECKIKFYLRFCFYKKSNLKIS